MEIPKFYLKKSCSWKTVQNSVSNSWSQLQLLKFVLYTSCINQNRTHKHELKTQYWTDVHFFGLILTLNNVFFLSIHQVSSKVTINLCLSLPSSTIFKAGCGRWEYCFCTYQEWDKWLNSVSHSVLTTTMFWTKLNPVHRQSLEVLKKCMRAWTLFGWWEFGHPTL